MSLKQKIEASVKQVLETNTVSKAKEILRARSGVKVMAIISFVEGALPLPVLTDPFLVAAILVDKKNTFKLILATTLSSVLGGLLAYFMALFFFETLASLMSPGALAQFNSVADSSTSSTFVLTMVGAVTPVPYTIVAWAVAVLNGNVFAFIAASLLGRGLRYSIVGYSVYHFGHLAVSYSRRYIAVTSVLVFILAGLFFWLKM